MAIVECTESAEAEVRDETVVAAPGNGHLAVVRRRRGLPAVPLSIAG